MKINEAYIKFQSLSPEQLARLPKYAQESYTLMRGMALQLIEDRDRLLGAMATEEPEAGKLYYGVFTDRYKFVEVDHYPGMVAMMENGARVDLRMRQGNLQITGTYGPGQALVVKPGASNYLTVAVVKED